MIDNKKVLEKLSEIEDLLDDAVFFELIENENKVFETYSDIFKKIKELKDMHLGNGVHND